MLTKLHPRQILRSILGAIATATIKKHQPTIIVITGSGQTSVLRECLYTILHEDYHVRRNIEIPETEFSIPINIFGEHQYPQNIYDWLKVLNRTLIRLIGLKPYQHTLILEIPKINHNIYKYWIDILKPRYVINIENTIDLLSYVELSKAIKTSCHEILRDYKISDQKIEQQLEKVNLPQSKIKIIKGLNNSTIIDSTYYYYPIPLKATLELADHFEGKKILITSNKAELDIAKAHSDLSINPSDYIPSKGNIIIIRGDKATTKDLLNKFTN